MNYSQVIDLDSIRISDFLNGDFTESKTAVIEDGHIIQILDERWNLQCLF